MHFSRRVVRKGASAFAAATLLVSVLLVAGGASAHTGHWIDSAFASTVPTIDGTMPAGEWADAFAFDIGMIPGNALQAVLLVKNDASFLYLAYDAVGDTTMDGSDGASFAFDTFHDAAMTGGEEHQFFWGPAAGNGQEHWVSDGFSWYVEDSPFDGGLPNHAGLLGAYGFGTSDFSGVNHRIYELQIPLALLRVSPGEVTGFLGASQAAPGVFDGPTFAYSTWPVFLFGPPPLRAYGDLRLAMPSLPDDLDINPPSQTMTAAAGGSVLYPLFVYNRGTSPDVFDLFTVSVWNMTLLDESGLNPLPDTDGDTVPDTGIVDPGNYSAIRVRVDLPDPVSGCDDGEVVGLSSNDPFVADFALLRTCGRPASLNPPHADYGVDTDVPPNGLYDFLVIDVSLSVTMDGFYFIDVTLFDVTQSIFITSQLGSSYLLAGPGTISVDLAGSSIYASGVDGPYVAYIEVFDDMFNLLDSGFHTTAAYVATDFDPPGAALNPPHADYGVDTDVPPNGLYDFLVIDVNVSVITDGRYYVSLALFDVTQSIFITSQFGSSYLLAGPGTISVDLAGSSIYASGIDGPYVAYFELYDDFSLLDTGFHTTAAYVATDFDPPGAVFSPPHADYGVDTDVPPNGLYDLLVLEVGVDVTEAGVYDVSAFMVDPFFNFVASASASASLGPGLQTVRLEFLGRNIFQSGLDGPYTAYLDLSSAGVYLDSDMHVTAFYAASDFDGLPASFAPPHTDVGVDLDIPPDGLFEFLEVRVSVDVAEAGTYTIMAMLYHPIGLTLGTALVTANLVAGLQSVPVRFSGIPIRDSGLDGPYGVDLVLLDTFGALDFDTHTTGAYRAGGFSPAGATFAPPHADYLVDNDVPPDGLADRLAVDVRLNVVLPGTYTVNGLLLDLNGPFLGADVACGTLPAGPATCTLTFDGHAIARMGSAGPFLVFLQLFDGYGRLLASDVHLTAPYVASDFEPADAVVPVATVGPVPYWRNAQPLDVPWRASDAVPTDGLASVTLHYRYSADNATWGAWTPFLTVAASGSSDAGTIPFTFPSGPGYYELQATARDASGNVELAGPAESRVAFRPLATLVVTPSSFSLPAGIQTDLTIEVRDPTGAPATLESPLTVSLASTSGYGEFRMPGTVIMVTSVVIPAGASSATIDYYDTAAGTWTLRASSPRTADGTAVASVAAGFPASAAVTPSQVAVQVGQTRQFTAAAWDTYGNPVAATFTWTATAGAGTITPAGLLTAATAVGTGTVTATVVGAPTVQATASVTLVAGPAASVTVTPSTISVQVGQTRQFTAAAWDTYGNPVAATFTWTATAGAGAISPTGLLTAATAVGSGTVTASVVGAPTVQGTSAVTLVPGPPASVAVSPATGTTVVDGTLSFTATVRDEYGNAIPGAPVTWSVLGGIGSVSATGAFTAGRTAGSGSVVASSGDVQGTATVTVGPGPAARIVLSPASAVLAVGASATFSAQVVDQYGNAVSGATVAWSATGGIGNVNATGAFTAGTTVGTGRVVATSGTLEASALVTLQPGPAASVRLSPPSATLRWGSSIDLRAAVLDAYGNAVGNATVSWAVHGPGTLSAATGATTRLTTTGPGAVTVTATSGAASATATFTAIEEGSSGTAVAGIGIGGVVLGLLIGFAVGAMLKGRGKRPAPEAEPERGEQLEEEGEPEEEEGEAEEEEL